MCIWIGFSVGGRGIGREKGRKKYEYQSDSLYCTIKSSAIAVHSCGMNVHYRLIIFNLFACFFFPVLFCFVRYFLILR